MFSVMFFLFGNLSLGVLVKRALIKKGVGLDESQTKMKIFNKMSSLIFFPFLSDVIRVCFVFFCLFFAVLFAFSEMLSLCKPLLVQNNENMIILSS